MIKIEKKENLIFLSIIPFLSIMSIKILTRLRVQFSHLTKDKFRNGLGYTMSPMFGFNAETENTEHILWHYHFHSIQRF